MRAGKENPRDSVEEGDFPKFIGQQAAGEGPRGGGWGCNNLKTGGDSGSSSRDLCRGRAWGYLQGFVQSAPHRPGAGGEFEHDGQGKGRSLPLTPTPSPQIRRSIGSATLPAPAQGLILELLGGMKKCPQFSSGPCPAPKSPRCPMQGEEGQDWLKAPPAEPAHPPLTPSIPREQQRRQSLPPNPSQGSWGVTRETPPRPLSSCRRDGDEEEDPGPWLRARGRWRCG